jgi:hypothetical protein
MNILLIMREGAASWALRARCFQYRKMEKDTPA